MKARIADFSIDFATRKQRLTLILDDDFREFYDKFKEELLEVGFRLYRKKRSLNANAYCWELLGKLAEKMSLPAEEIYRNAIRAVGIYQDVELTEKAAKTMRHIWEAHGIGWISEQVDKTNGGVLIRFWYGSSCYNTVQMARLIDYIVADCKELGIETKTPDEIERMKALWKT